MSKSNFTKGCSLKAKMRKVKKDRIGCDYKHGKKVLIVDGKCKENCKLRNNLEKEERKNLQKKKEF